MKIIKKALLIPGLILLLLLSACSAGKQEKEETNERRILDVTFTREDAAIAGKLYLPAGEGPFPAAIICHGFGGNMQYLLHYGRFLSENGIAACLFDFIGGGPASASGGDMMDMSVKTEAADLDAVIDGLCAREDIDAGSLFLIGSSQGGFITAMTAAERPEDIRAMICLYPGFGMQDYLRTLPAEDGSLPESVEMLGHTVGRKYIEDALSVDIHACMEAYPGPVLILHGTADRIAPYFYSIQATRYFPDAQLVPVKDADHVFQGEDDDFAMENMLDFLRKQLTPSED